MDRLVRWMDDHHPDARPPGTRWPAWLSEPDIELAVPCASDELAVLRSIRHAMVVMACRAGATKLDASLKGADDVDIEPRRLVALVRLAYGELLETIAVVRALGLAPADEAPSDSASVDIKTEFARVCMDSFLVSVWTSAHLEFLAWIHDALAIMPEACTSDDVLPPAPSPMAVPWSIGSLPDLTLVLDRKTPNGKLALACKQTNAIAALLCRCTNSGSRGWDAAIAESIKDGEGCARICQLLIVATLTGLHPALHPAMRPSWDLRSRISSLVTSANSRQLLSACSSASKEAMRLYLSMMYSAMPATREAMRAAAHPAGQLVISPFEVTNPSMLAAMKTLARVGTEVVRLGTADGIVDIASSLLEDHKRLKRPLQPSQNVPVGASHVTSYTPSWLGRSQNANNRGQSVIEAVNNAFMNSFKADFVPLWMKLWQNGFRLSRLDAARHAVLHRSNILFRLTAQLPDEERLWLQRLALRSPLSSLHSVATIARRIGVRVPVPSNRGVVAIDDINDATTAAKLLTFGRAAGAKAHLLSYSLGPHTRAMQLRALAKRFLLDVKTLELEDIPAKLPQPALNILACVECKRVANACHNAESKPGIFNELGTSSSMLRIDGDIGCGHLRCAKRSSAALRTALGLEEAAEALTRDVAPSEDAADASPFDTNSPNSKLRRDTKSSFDQTGSATSCGDQALVVVPILGRVIRLFGSCFALCSFCGVLCNVTPHNRFCGEICCLTCDSVMLSKDRPGIASAALKAVAPAARIRKCRYCGRTDNSSDHATKWRRARRFQPSFCPRTLLLAIPHSP